MFGKSKLISMSSHIQPEPKTVDKYNDLMAQIRQGKADANASYADLGKAMNRTRLNAIHLVGSDNISLKNFISLANAVGLEVTLSKSDQ